MEEFVKATFKGNTREDYVEVDTEIRLDNDKNRKAKLAMCILALSEKLVQTDDDCALLIEQITEVYLRKGKNNTKVTD